MRLTLAATTQIVDDESQLQKPTISTGYRSIFRYYGQMSILLETYRQNAAAARAEAQQATLPNIRARAAEAATRWSEMADRLERVEALKKRD